MDQSSIGEDDLGGGTGEDAGKACPDAGGLSGKLGRDRASEVSGAFGTCRWNFCGREMSGSGISGTFPAAGDQDRGY